MLRHLRNMFDDTASNTRARIVAVYAVLAVFNGGAWVWAFVAFHAHPVLLGTAFLAYSLGLRHAVDADHIAAIDNVTRKLMQENKRPVAVGLMFSLGHSTIVVVGSVAIAATARALQHRFDAVRDVGGLIGTLVSCLFLFGIAIVNLIVLQSILRAFLRVRHGEPYVEEDFDLLLGSRGFLSRLFRPMFNMIRRSWHMYPLGVLFAAGMSLIDTTDNILMLGAYGWAYIKPIRKLYYNITITFVSVVVAFAVGGVEGLGLLADHFHPQGRMWGWVNRMNGNFGALGYFIIGIFVASWVVSIAIYKWRGYDRLELNT